MSLFEYTITLVAGLLVLTALLAYLKTHVRADFYLGTGGLLMLFGAVATVLPPNYNNGLIGFGLLLLGWGFARSLTIDNDQLNRLNFVGLFSGKFGQIRKPKLTSRSDALIASSILVVAGLICWFFKSSYRTVAYIFILFGLEALVATFLFMKRKDN